MHVPVRPTTEEPHGFVRDAVGPSYEALRPGREPTTGSFPVHPDLSALMSKDGLAHPDPAVAQVLATAAGYAYSDAGTVAMMMTRMGLENSLCRQVSRRVDAMLISSTAHLVQSEDGRVVVLAFRGTPPLDLVSWFLDADVYPERVAAVGSPAEGSAAPYDVHAGFYRNVRITRYEIVHALLRAARGGSVLGDVGDRTLVHEVGALDSADDAGGRGRQRAPMEALYVTGHSLGGAMAVLFAAMLLMNDRDQHGEIASRLRGVYTFGQPMVGSPAFAAAAEEAFAAAEVPVLRYAYGKDPVPLLPPRSVGRFAHVGQELRRSSAGSWEPVDSSPQMPLVAGAITSLASYGLTRFPLLREVPFRYRIEDHLPHHYVSSLVPPGGLDEFGDVRSWPAGDA